MKTVQVSSSDSSNEGVIVVEWQGFRAASCSQREGRELADALWLLLPTEACEELLHGLAEKFHVEIAGE